MKKSMSAGAATLLLLLSPSALLAHPMQGVGDFYAGMLHPLTAIEWVLPMVALSLLAGQQGREPAICIMIAFPISLATGAIAGCAFPTSSQLEIVNLASIAALGLLVAWAGGLPLKLCVPIAVLVGLPIGFANGAELTSATSPYRFIPGLTLVGLLLMSYGVGFVRWLKAPWTKIGVRVVGSWIAAVGILTLGLKR